MSSQDLDSIILKSETEGDRYLELFYRLFNRYIKYKKSQLEDFDIDTNDIVKESIDVDFGVDIEKISNETTKKILHDNPEYKSIFIALLGSLKSKKSDSFKSLVMTPNLVRLFNDIVDKINLKVEKPDIEDDLSFDSYLKTLKNKNIINLDINNAPEDVKQKNKFPQQELELKNPEGALSFADFKKKDEKKKEDKEQKKEIKSIEDMINDLQKSVKDMSLDIKDLKSDTKDIKKEEKNNNSDKSDKTESDKETDDDKKSDNNDDKKSKDENNSKEDDETSNKKEDDETSNNEDNKDEDKEDDKSSNKENNDSPLSGL